MDLFYFSGDSLAKASSYLNAAVLMGLLSSGSSGKLNLVSAPAAASTAGVQVRRGNEYWWKIDFKKYLNAFWSGWKIILMGQTLI